MRRQWIVAVFLSIALLICGCNAEAPAQTDPPGASFLATVLEINGASALVAPLEGEAVSNSCDRISLATAALEDISARTGDVVRVFYDGNIMETYPAQITATAWEQVKDLRFMEYTESWLDREKAEESDDYVFDHIVITKIYKNCFFATPAIPMPYTIKLNGVLSEEWCVGDQVQCTYENTFYDAESNRIECDMVTVKESDWQPDPYAAYKPVICLYPEEKTEVSVKLELDGELTCTYPAYADGWRVTAMPDGTLTDQKGQTYNYLYWEGQTNGVWDMTKGFCVKGADTAKFLEEALERLGLTRREANEFIVYWLPLMEQNPYNLISFQGESYEEAAKLQIDPGPDTLIRVFMTWRASESYVNLEAQKLTAPDREGFTVVEWGGTEVK